MRDLDRETETDLYVSLMGSLRVRAPERHEIVMRLLRALAGRDRLNAADRAALVAEFRALAPRGSTVTDQIETQLARSAAS